ncbi:MAG: succinate dehydrogenase assembly factor 2 [Gammaproteobacteria bacterium]|jgi:antitoxin CptB
MQIQANNDSDRRLAWQCRRGMRELDELLTGFLARGYAGLDADGRAAFDTLLAYPDAVLLELLMGRMTPADKDAAGIVRAIRNTAAV